MTTARHGYSNSNHFEGSEVERRHIAVYFLFLLLPFCGRVRVLEDPKIYEAVFHEDARRYGWDSYPTTIPVKYKFEENHRSEGSCDFSNNTVTFDAETWELSTNTHREILLRMELGHCLLMRNHRESKCSLMRKNLMPDDEYLANKEMFTAELFSMRGSKVINEENYNCPIVTE